MAKNWKILALIIIIVAIFVIGYSQFKSKAPQAPISSPEKIQLPVASEGQKEQPIIIAPATGNIDDTVNAIIGGIADDQELFNDIEKDAELIGSDSQDINDFGQSYNENEF